MACYLCIEIIKDRITLPEALYAMKEFVVPEGHNAELVKTIEDKFGKDKVVDTIIDLHHIEGAD